ncbi:hypothetical protein KQI68_09425 [Peptoniphilus sp. MSJ-1]|uniref:Lipoprotein n=1 Tax=Peptoniphilus ovalis TaxID=2841503 RepID=A0ABS6FLJ6_9FIRM|nr:hypothetical protein [Peptoniphilus ovalis]MBU5670050.1 hypothetical protein [Peptoniphilus ovalis]
MNFKRYFKDVGFILILSVIIFSITHILLNLTSEKEIFTKNFKRFGIDIEEIEPNKIIEIENKEDKYHIYKYILDEYKSKDIKNQMENNMNLISYSFKEFENKVEFKNFSELLISKDKYEWNLIFNNSPRFYILFLSNENSYYYNLAILIEDKNIIYFVN